MFANLAAGEAHYRGLGFEPFDKVDGEWSTLWKDGGVFEAYIRRANVLEWRGSVVQLRDDQTHER
jgi:hypothetical protein